MGAGCCSAGLGSADSAPVGGPSRVRFWRWGLRSQGRFEGEATSTEGDAASTCAVCLRSLASAEMKYYRPRVSNMDYVNGRGCGWHLRQ